MSTENMSTETARTCHLIQTQGAYHGKQDLTYFEGVSAQSVGAAGICMHLVTIPPGARAKAHLHEAHETTIYVLDGISGMYFGENLAEHMIAKAGDMIYIPAGVPHLPYNASLQETCTAVLARTDPNEQESVVLLPDLDGVPEWDTVWEDADTG